MKIYKKQWRQVVPGKIEDMWDFFSRPENLDEITPKDMQFEIMSDVEGIKMYPGITIDYKVSPFPFMKMNWRTEITEIKEGMYFIDEQRIGPYRIWRHQHHFEQQGEQVVMTDKLEYALPLGVLGRIANSLFVSNRIEEIFDYRFAKVEAIFGKPYATEAA